MTDQQKTVQDAPESADGSRRAFIKKAGVAAAAAPAATLLLSARATPALAQLSGVGLNPGTNPP